MPSKKLMGYRVEWEGKPGPGCRWKRFADVYITLRDAHCLLHYFQNSRRAELFRNVTLYYLYGEKVEK